MYTCVYRGIIHNIQLLEIQISINWWMHKPNVVYPYNEMSLSKEKEWRTNTYLNMHESQKLYIKLKKPDVKYYILYDSIYMKYPEKINP